MGKKQFRKELMSYLEHLKKKGTYMGKLLKIETGYILYNNNVVDYFMPTLDIVIMYGKPNSETKKKDKEIFDLGYDVYRIDDNDHIGKIKLIDRLISCLTWRSSVTADDDDLIHKIKKRHKLHLRRKHDNEVVSKTLRELDELFNL